MIKRIYEPETGLWQLDENKFTNGKLPEFNNCGNDEFVKILCESKETAKILIENIEKSVAKEPIGQDLHGKTGGHIHKYVCPICENFLANRWEANDDHNAFCPDYCSECGQKIDWSEFEK